MAHHDNWARKALDETAEYARAIEMARTMTSEEDTLIIVSSDHSHVFTYNGYPRRHSDVLFYNNTLGDGLPMETLTYADGPGYWKTYDVNGRVDIRGQDFTHKDRQYSAGVPLEYESHAADDVGIYASGPWSHLFQGSYELSVVGMAMAYAGELGPYEEVPTNTEEVPTTTEENSGSSLIFYPILILLNLIFVKFA